MAKVILGYWAIRGYAEPARTMLEFGNIEYENNLYSVGPAPDYDRSCWYDVKYKLGLDFPNLPYLVDGDFKLSESWAIYRYIGGKANLTPTDNKDIAVCTMLEGKIQDMRSMFTMPCYRDVNSLKDFPEKAESQHKAFNSYLNGKAFLTGDNVSYVDFPFFETLDHQRTMFPDIFDKYENIKAFIERFESLEAVSKYRKSPRFKKSPINNPSAQWTG